MLAVVVDCETGGFNSSTDALLEIAGVLQGARDIMAEWVNEDEKSRGRVRYAFEKDAIVRSNSSAFHDETVRSCHLTTLLQFSHLMKL